MELTRRDFLVGTAAIAGAGALAACGSSGGKPSAAGSSGSGGAKLLAQMKSRGYAKLAVANQAPYSLVKPDGTVTGLEPDICKAVLGKMGITKFHGQVVDFSAMIPGLIAKQFDLLTAALFITAPRCKQITYSEPDVLATYSLAVPAGNPKQLASAQDCLTKGVTLAVLNGDYGTGVVEQKYPKMKTLTFQAELDQIQAVANGRVGASLVLTQETSIGSSTKNKVSITPPIPDVTPEAAAVGFRLDDADFRDEYDKTYLRLKSDGTIESIYKKYNLPFGPLAQFKKTTAQICAG